MTGKRYYEKRYGEEFYILDSNIISEKDFEDKLEIHGYKAFEDSMMGDEVVNRLNKLNNENKELKLQLEAFKDKLCELGVSDVKLYGKRYYTGLDGRVE